MNKKIYYALGRPFSPWYSLAMRLRERFYKKGIFRSTGFKVPVISIGNLTMGGSGKTPMVGHLARMLLDNGYRPAVISRGYGGATREPVNLVSDGTEVLLDASYVGDEPCMLAHALPGVPVLTGVVRKLPAARAVELGADVLLLDDGFQHLAVQRDLDLVLFNADFLAGNSRVSPGGDLREPVKALERGHCFVLTGTDEQNRERAERFAGLLEQRFPGRPVFYCGSRVTGLIRRQADGQKTRLPLEALANSSPFAFCGIARPEGFARTLEGLAINTSGFHVLPDHHLYKPSVVRQLASRAEKAGADCFLCTEKDLVKLDGFDFNLPLYALSMELEPDPGLDGFIREKLAGLQEKLDS